MTPVESRTARARREPPPFRRVVVRRVEWVSPRLVRITLTGGELEGFAVDDPAASVRLLLPSPGSDLVVPTWRGNEFLLAGDRRPTIRTFTPRRVDAELLELDLDIVVHGSGVASEWAAAATPGLPAAISGPGRGYAVDRDAPAFVLVGDETALAAISQLLEVLPADRPVQVMLEVAQPTARIDLPPHPRTTVVWWTLEPGASPGDALVAAVRAAQFDPGARVWAAGEASAVQRIRRHLFEEREMPRSRTSIRGYWKRDRSGDTADDA